MRSIVIPVLLLLGAAACKQESRAAALPSATAVPLPELPKIGGEKADLTFGASQGKTTGTTYAHQEAQIGPKMSGVITEIAVREADVVKKDDVLFKQDPSDFVLRIQQADVAMSAANLNLKATETEYLRTKQLFESQAVNRAAWEQMDARFESAKIGVEQAKVALAMAKKAYGDTIVKSPLDGVVVAKLKSAGEMATMMPPTIVLIVQEQTTLDLKFRLPEHALQKITPGQTLSARFEAMGITREAKIARIMPSVDARTRTVEVVAELSNADLALKPGMLAEVELGVVLEKAEAARGTP